MPSDAVEEVHPDKIRNLNENFLKLKVRVASPKGGMVRNKATDRPQESSGDLNTLNPPDTSTSNNVKHEFKNPSATQGTKRPQ